MDDLSLCAECNEFTVEPLHAAFHRGEDASVEKYLGDPSDDWPLDVSAEASSMLIAAMLKSARDRVNSGREHMLEALNADRDILLVLVAAWDEGAAFPAGLGMAKRFLEVGNGGFIFLNFNGLVDHVREGGGGGEGWSEFVTMIESFRRVNGSQLDYPGGNAHALRVFTSLAPLWFELEEADAKARARRVYELAGEPFPGDE